MQRQLKILIYFIVFCLCGCGIAPVQRTELERLKLLPPIDGPEHLLLKQKITMVSHGLNQQFIVVIRLQQDRLKLAALLPTGQQLLFLDYDGVKLIQKNYSSMEISGEDILAVMQFAFWPSHSIEQQYTKEEGWIVEISPEHRTLLTSAGLLIQVSYYAETIMIDNHFHNYWLKVQPLENINI